MLRQLGLWMSIAAWVLAPGSAALAQSLEEEQAAMEGEGEEPPAAPAGEDAEDAGDAAEPGADDAAEPGADDAAPETGDGAGAGLLGDEQADMEEQAPVEQRVSPIDPHEEENVDYFFLGAFYRHVIIPGFIQELFVAGGIDGSNPGFGLEFGWRRNNFNIIANVWWNNASADGYFRASGDPRTDTEYVRVDLWAVFVNAAFLWSFPIVDWFAIELGFDLGFGFVGGRLSRNEAYESSPGSDDFHPCDGPGDPADPGGYCEPPAPDPCYANDGGHYNCTEPRWTTRGGDTPVIVPWLALPHLAVRFKPIHQLQIRIDGGWGLTHFFFGGSASYGF